MTEDELNTAEAAILERHGLSKTQVANAAEKEPTRRTPTEQACIVDLMALWQSAPSLTPGDALTIAGRAAVAAITAIVATLPLGVRAAVVEEAFGAALPIAWADNFEASYGKAPTPVLLIGGEIATDVIAMFEEPAR
jgi:hypothetical protein